MLNNEPGLPTNPAVARDIMSEDAVALMRQYALDGLGFNCTFVDDDMRLLVCLAQRAVLAGLASDARDDLLQRFTAAAEAEREGHENALGYRIRRIKRAKAMPPTGPVKLSERSNTEFFAKQQRVSHASGEGRMKLNDLSPEALRAAMRGGTEAWGQWASALEHVRYVEVLPPPYNRRRCHCGCKKRATHSGKCNGIALASGCELSMRRWVRDPLADARRRYMERAAREGLPLLDAPAGKGETDG